jgi:hypothetical protein
MALRQYRRWADTASAWLLRKRLNIRKDLKSERDNWHRKPELIWNRTLGPRDQETWSGVPGDRQQSHCDYLEVNPRFWVPLRLVFG